MSTARGDDFFDDDYVPDDLAADSPGDDATTLSDSEGNELAAAVLTPTPSTSTAARTAAKKRKRREKEKEKRTKKRCIAKGLEPNESFSFAAQPPNRLAEYLAALQFKSFPHLSSIELDDLQIPESAILDTTSWTTLRTLDQLTDFIAKAVPSLKMRLSQKSKDTGAPTLLFVAGGALRVADICRVLRSRILRGEKGGDVAKLFARHIKLEDHVAYLSRTRIGAAVGTPGRIGKLLNETNSLSVTALTHIMLDVSYRDVKKRSMLDIMETRDEVFRTVLATPKILQGLKRGKIQLVLF